MPSLGFRASLFVLMTVGYITFLIALVERFGVLSSSEISTSKSSQLGSIPSSSPETPYTASVIQETLDSFPYQNVLSPSSSTDSIEICATDEDCYTYYPGIVPRRSSLGNLEPAVTRSTGYVIRSVSHWAWRVLKGNVRPRGTRGFQRRGGLRAIEAREAKWKCDSGLITANIHYQVLAFHIFPSSFVLGCFCVNVYLEFRHCFLGERLLSLTLRCSSCLFEFLSCYDPVWCDIPACFILLGCILVLD